MSESGFQSKINSLDCKICKTVSSKVCRLIPDSSGKLQCIDDIEEMSKSKGDWARAKNAMIKSGIYDDFIEEYSRATNKPVNAIRALFDRIDIFQSLRDKDNSTTIETSLDAQTPKTEVIERPNTSTIVEISDGREDRFSQYNVDNIYTNLIQLEQHFKDITPEDLKAGHGQCCVKHSSMVIGELDELMSHVAKDGEDPFTGVRNLRDAMSEFKDSMQDRTPAENILVVRAVRKQIEKMDPKYDTSKCKACGGVDRILDNDIIDVQVLAPTVETITEEEMVKRGSESFHEELTNTLMRFFDPLGLFSGGNDDRGS